MATANYKFLSASERQCVIYLIRHGESVGNLNRVCLGHTDLGLTDRGLAQAKLTADTLMGLKIDGVYSSDLLRAMDTARPHAEIRGLPVNGRADLRELYFGQWENKAVDYLRLTYGDMFDIGWRKMFGTFVAPDGEAVVDMAKRAKAALSEIGRRHLGGSVIVASHAALIRALWADISGKAPEEYADFVTFPTNASFTVIVYESDKLIPVSYSNDLHMGELKTGIQTK